MLATELLDINREVELSNCEYNECLNAWRIVTECLAIEESFGYVIADLLDLESVIHRHVLDGICTPRGEWSQLMDRVHDLSRRVTHLLGSSEAYLASTPQRLKAAFGSEHAILNRWHAMTAVIEGSGIEAMLWKALRDLAHHRDSPVGGITVHASLAIPPGSEPVRVEHTMALLLNDKVRSGKPTRRRRKKKSTEKIAGLAGRDVPPNYDIRPLIQKHVSQLGKLHADLRAAIALEHQRATACIDKAVARFANACGVTPDQAYTTLAVVHPAGGVTSRTPLHRQWSDRYDALQKRYGGVATLFQSVITTLASDKEEKRRAKELLSLSSRATQAGSPVGVNADSQ